MLYLKTPCAYGHLNFFCIIFSGELWFYIQMYGSYWINFYRANNVSAFFIYIFFTYKYLILLKSVRKTIVLPHWITFPWSKLLFVLTDLHLGLSIWSHYFIGIVTYGFLRSPGPCLWCCSFKSGSFCAVACLCLRYSAQWWLFWVFSILI